MIYLDNENITDPRLNLALEEYALRNLDKQRDYVLFYINEPSVIIGRHQNTLEEIHTEYIEANAVHVVRRISGGGAVYHDFGNLNFSFITKYRKSNFNNYRKFTAPVIQALHQLGVNAELNGRNDITVGGKKISGNAQFTSKDRMLSHGTLLFNSNLKNVVAALNVKAGKIESKAIKSIRSRVANISEFLTGEMDTVAFRDYLLSHLFAGQETIPTYRFSESEWEAIRQLAERKYQSWDWNFGESPAFNIQQSHRFPIGEIEARILVEKGRIENIKFYGDFFAEQEITELEKLLLNVRYTKNDLELAIQNLDITRYFGNISGKEFLELMF